MVASLPFSFVLFRFSPSREIMEFKMAKRNEATKIMEMRVTHPKGPQLCDGRRSHVRDTPVHVLDYGFLLRGFGDNGSTKVTILRHHIRTGYHASESGGGISRFAVDCLSPWCLIVLNVLASLWYRCWTRRQV